MIEVRKHCIHNSQTISDALFKLNELGQDLTLFVLNENEAVIGTLTDGDIRRGLLNEFSLKDRVDSIMKSNFSFLRTGSYNFNEVRTVKERGVNILPVIDHEDKIVKLLNLSQLQAILPIDVVIMAGGKGERLAPLTNETPKPLLKIGSKPILEHTIDRLTRFGVQQISLSINYHGDQIFNYFKDGKGKGISIKYIRESKPLGTIGSLSLAEPFTHDVLLLMNSDVLTNIDFDALYNEFVRTKADMAVAAVPHHVDLPYAILELEDETVSSLREKPRYTYFANAGIYLFKKELLNFLPKGEFYNATDLMEKIISAGKKLIHFPILGYWLDIGRVSDYEKAQEDFKHINF